MEDKRYTREDFAEMLRKRGVNPTHQRLEIMQVLFSRDEHLSADQILALVNQRNAAISRATVYNTLNVLAEKQLIRKVILEADRVLYDPNASAHYHIYDIETGKLIDVDATGVRVEGLPQLPSGTVAESMDLVIRVRRR